MSKVDDIFKAIVNESTDQPVIDGSEGKPAIIHEVLCEKCNKVECECEPAPVATESEATIANPVEEKSQELLDEELRFATLLIMLAELTGRNESVDKFVATVSESMGEEGGAFYSVADKRRAETDKEIEIVIEDLIKCHKNLTDMGAGEPTLAAKFDESLKTPEGNVVSVNEQ